MSRLLGEGLRSRTSTVSSKVLNDLRMCLWMKFLVSMSMSGREYGTVIGINSQINVEKGRRENAAMLYTLRCGDAE